MHFLSKYIAANFTKGFQIPSLLQYIRANVPSVNMWNEYYITNYNHILIAIVCMYVFIHIMNVVLIVQNIDGGGGNGNNTIPIYNRQVCYRSVTELLRTDLLHVCYRSVFETATELLHMCHI